MTVCRFRVNVRPNKAIDKIDISFVILLCIRFIRFNIYIYKTQMKTRHIFEEHLYFDRLVGLLQGEEI